MGGVWRYSRQANYLGEGLFWLANYGAAVRSFTSAPQALGAAIGTAAIVAIIASETKRRERQREARYGGQPFWEDYKRDTAQIVPFCHWIYTGTPTPEEAGKPEKFRL
jgi:steroid 5-alpha reductase family enzyme